LKADKILFRATAPGGTSLVSDADFFAARVADDVILAGGVGMSSEVVIDKLPIGKSLAVQPFIDEIREGMRGGSALRDLEAMLQLICLRFTAPRADATVFACRTQCGRSPCRTMSSDF
jgi:zinc protease